MCRKKRSDLDATYAQTWWCGLVITTYLNQCQTILTVFGTTLLLITHCEHMKTINVRNQTDKVNATIKSLATWHRKGK